MYRVNKAQPKQLTRKKQELTLFERFADLEIANAYIFRMLGQFCAQIVLEKESYTVLHHCYNWFLQSK